MNEWHAVMRKIECEKVEERTEQIGSGNAETEGNRTIDPSIKEKTITKSKGNETVGGTECVLRCVFVRKYCATNTTPHYTALLLSS